jgi:hypothetical protein
MATFAWWFLIWEAVMRAGTTALMNVLPQENWAPAVTFFVFAALSGLSAVAFLVGMPADEQKAEAAGSLCGKASKALALWSDPKLWMLQFTNLTFGFGAAWNASYVGPHFTQLALDAKFIGFTGALISLIGGFGSKLLGYLAQAIGKQAIILLGAVAFLAIGVLSKVLHDGAGMGWSVLIFPVLMGIGRAVYESTNKAVFLDFYPQPETHPGVFGNVMMFGTLSSTIVFILSSANVFTVVIYLLIAFAVCTYPGILLAAQIRAKQAKADTVAPLTSDMER